MSAGRCPIVGECRKPCPDEPGCTAVSVAPVWRCTVSEAYPPLVFAWYAGPDGPDGGYATITRGECVIRMTTGELSSLVQASGMWRPGGA